MSTRWQELDDAAKAMMPQVIAGERSAWHEFLVLVMGETKGGRRKSPIQAMARRAPIGWLRTDEDHLANIEAVVIERLRNNDRRALKRFAERPDGRFSRWLARVVRRCAIKYMTGLFEYNPPPTGVEASHWLIAVEVATSMFQVPRAELTRADLCRRIASLAEKHLKDEQRMAVELWLQLGESKSIYAEIAEEMTKAKRPVSEEQARRHLRAGLEALRRLAVDIKSRLKTERGTTA